MYAVTITKLELLRTNPSFGEVRAEVFFLVEGRGGRAGNLHLVVVVVSD